jgi:hypothetical protein
MTLRLVLTVDESESAELIGLLAKALGKGELGIIEFKLDAVHEDRRPTRPVALPKPVVKPKKPHALKGKPRPDRLGVAAPGSPSLGGARFQAVQEALKDRAEFRFRDVRAVLNQNGFAWTGVGGALRQWTNWKLVEKIGPGIYRLLPSQESAAI